MKQKRDNKGRFIKNKTELYYYGDKYCDNCKHIEETSFPYSKICNDCKVTVMSDGKIIRSNWKAKKIIVVESSNPSNYSKNCEKCKHIEESRLAFSKICNPCRATVMSNGEIARSNFEAKEVLEVLEIGKEVKDLSLLKTGMVIDFEQGYTDDKDSFQQVKNAVVYVNELNPTIYACYNEGYQDGFESPNLMSKKHSWVLGDKREYRNVIFRGYEEEKVMEEKDKIIKHVDDLKFLKTGMVIDFEQRDYGVNEWEKWITVKDAIVFVKEYLTIERVCFACYDNGLSGANSPNKMGKKLSWDLGYGATRNIVFKGYNLTTPLTKPVSEQAKDFINDNYKPSKDSRPISEQVNEFLNDYSRELRSGSFSIEGNNNLTLMCFLQRKEVIDEIQKTGIYTIEYDGKHNCIKIIVNKPSKCNDCNNYNKETNKLTLLSACHPCLKDFLEKREKQVSPSYKVGDVVTLLHPSIKYTILAIDRNMVWLKTEDDKPAYRTTTLNNAFMKPYIKESKYKVKDIVLVKELKWTVDTFPSAIYKIEIIYKTRYEVRNIMNNELFVIEENDIIKKIGTVTE